MAQPTPYTPVHTFVSDSATLANFPGQQLDVEFNDIKATTDQIRANLALIQRDDGQPANGIVTYDTLSPALQTNGLSTAAAWVSGTNYTVGTTVYQNFTLYRCLIAHTAGVFATDLAVAKWLLLTALPIGPQGIQGLQGIQGIQGVQGIQGIPGNTGAVGSGYGGTSATSLLIANSVTKVFTTQAGLAYLVGDYVRAKSAANGANYMEGLVSAYSGTTLALAVTAIGGAGTFSDWQINQSGSPGALFTPYYTVPVNASGSVLTTTGTISGASTALTLAASLDFINGQGIRINHAGAAFALNPPTAASVTPTGTTGATAYAYTIASLSSGRGVGVAIANVTTATGNVTLSTTNYNSLSWTAATGTAPIAYAIYGNKAGSLSLLAIVTGTNYKDTGAGATFTGADWIPSTPQVSALADALITTIVSGAGTTSLVLTAAATTAATTQTVLHDDTVALQAAITTASTTTFNVQLPAGIFRTTSVLTITTRMRISGVGYAGDSGGGYANVGVTSLTGLPGTVIAPDILNSTFTATTNAAIEIERLQISYVNRPISGATAINIQAVAGAGNANTQSAIRNVMITGTDRVATLTNVLGAWVVDSQFLYSWSSGITMDSPNYPNYNQNVISGNLFTGWGAVDNVQNQYAYHISLKAGGDMRITNNKLNNGSSTWTNAILLTGEVAGTQFMEPITIVGNSIEGGCANGICFTTANASFNTNQVVITGNQIWSANNCIVANSFGTSQWINDLIICGNALMVQTTATNVILIDNVGPAIITGNTFNCTSGSGGTAISLAAHTAGVSVQSNAYAAGFSTKVFNNGTGNSVGVASA